jgi:hypothetical protein
MTPDTVRWSPSSGGAAAEPSGQAKTARRMIISALTAFFFWQVIYIPPNLILIRHIFRRGEPCVRPERWANTRFAPTFNTFVIAARYLHFPVFSALKTKACRADSLHPAGLPILGLIMSDFHAVPA